MRYVSVLAAYTVLAILTFGALPARAETEFSVMGFSLAQTPQQVMDKA